MLRKLTVVIIYVVYIYISNRVVHLNLYNVICQLYLNKTGRKKSLSHSPVKPSKIRTGPCSLNLATSKSLSKCHFSTVVRAEASGVNGIWKCRLSETSLSTGTRGGHRDKDGFFTS